MPNTTLGHVSPPALSERLKAAMDIRLAAAGLSLKAFAAKSGQDDRKLRAWRSGEYSPGYAEIEGIDQSFAALGQPGLVQDMMAQLSWKCRQLRIDPAKLPPIARKLYDCARELRQADNIEDFLGRAGLLEHVHIMLLTDDDRVCMTRRGSKMPTASQIHRSVFGRDIRELEPKGYGLEIHPHIREVLQQGRPALHRITAPGMDYYRLGVPVDQFFVGDSFAIDVSEAFELR